MLRRTLFHIIKQLPLFCVETMLNRQTGKKWSYLIRAKSSVRF